jgi:hypothetical protein
LTEKWRQLPCVEVFSLGLRIYSRVNHFLASPKSVQRLAYRVGCCTNIALRTWACLRAYTVVSAICSWFVVHCAVETTFSSVSQTARLYGLRDLVYFLDIESEKYETKIDIG